MALKLEYSKQSYNALNYTPPTLCCYFLHF
jgi:hypothetical protein